MDIIAALLIIIVFAGILALMAKLFEPIMVLLTLCAMILKGILKACWTILCVAFYILTIPIHKGNGF